MDLFDKNILQALRNNSKLTIKELSQSIHLSLTATFERVRKLEREDYILGYSTELNYQKLGYNLVALCQITLEKHQKDIITKFEADIIQFDEIVECHHISGKHDYLLKIVVSDMTEYQKFISSQLSNIENIRQVESTFIMKSVKTNSGRKLV